MADDDDETETLFVVRRASGSHTPTLEPRAFSPTRTLDSNDARAEPRRPPDQPPFVQLRSGAAARTASSAFPKLPSRTTGARSTGTCPRPRSSPFPTATPSVPDRGTPRPRPSSPGRATARRSPPPARCTPGAGTRTIPSASTSTTSGSRARGRSRRCRPPADARRTTTTRDPDPQDPKPPAPIPTAA